MSKGLKLLEKVKGYLETDPQAGELINEIDEYLAEKTGAETKEGKPLDAPGDVTTFDAPADDDDLVGGRPDDRH